MTRVDGPLELDNMAHQFVAIEALTEMLRDHQSLRPLRWSLAPYTAGLTGELQGVASRYNAERHFAEWQTALGLALVPTESPRRLRAMGRAYGCQIIVAVRLPKEPHEYA